MESRIIKAPERLNSKRNKSKASIQELNNTQICPELTCAPSKSIASKTYGKEAADRAIDNYRQIKKNGCKKVNFQDCHQMSVKTIEKRRKSPESLYLML
ncbi:hypothetical protein TNCV_1381891 [Trichonephila clavipes]|nr:hypothetical protein TNCV_1381891 [Trichonephila clavipes]